MQLRFQLGLLVMFFCAIRTLSAQPPGFPGGPPMQAERKLLKEFDKNNDHWLNAEERQSARATAKNKPTGGGFRPPPGIERNEPAKPGPHVKPSDVRAYPQASLYESTVLRTFFLDFENPDWEQELQDFHGTDVEVPAQLTVDGKVYPRVGVGFRGMSSFMAVSAGSKRSLNLTLDLADSKQRLYGYKNLNLLNSHEDPSFLSVVLYSQIAREHVPAPKANLVKVVINGESWGVYGNAQQFDKIFLEENYPIKKGTRWKVSGSPGAAGGLEYLGERIEDYRSRFEIKSADSEEAWKKLIQLCQILNQTPTEKLESALQPILDLEGVLWFLALDVALINSDGYWTRASDYSIFLDEKGVFHLAPHDMNEAFHPPHGPPGGGLPFGRPGELIPNRLREELKLTPAQRQQLDKLQQETNEAILQMLDEEQRKKWKQFQQGPPPGGPGGGPAGGGFGLPFNIPGLGGRPPVGGPDGPDANGGIELDPLVGMNDPRKPLRSKLLAVPELKARYLRNVREIAEKSLDWKSLGPKVQQWRTLIRDEIELDTKKLSSLAAFERLTADNPMASNGREMPLRIFADQRRAYLLKAIPTK